MSTCNEKRSFFGDRLSMLLAGKLSPSEQTELSEHIVACEQCLRETAFVTHLVEGQPGPLGELLKPGLSCTECNELIPEYVETHVAEGPKTALARNVRCWAHLQTCPQCKELADTVLELASERED